MVNDKNTRLVMFNIYEYGRVFFYFFEKIHYIVHYYFKVFQSFANLQKLNSHLKKIPFCHKQ